MKFYYGTTDKGKNIVHFMGEILICNNPYLFGFLREENNKKGVLQFPKIEVHEWKESEE